MAFARFNQNFMLDSARPPHPFRSWCPDLCLWVGFTSDGNAMLVGLLEDFGDAEARLGLG